MLVENLLSEQRIQEIWSRYHVSWSSKGPDRIPFKLNIPTDTKYKRTYPEYYSSDDFLNYQLAVINKHYHLGLADDFLPIVYPPHDTGTIARAFGSKPFYGREELPAFLPVIHEPEEVYELDEPDLNENEWFLEHLERTKRIQKKIPSPYYVGLYDLQSTLDVAVLIWHYEDLMRAMYTNPEEVHVFLSMVTNALIHSIRINLEVLDKPIPFGPDNVDLPLGQGIHISDDMMAVLSPKIYREFGVPYNNKLSREFGGISLHSCGKFIHNVENLAEIRDLRGMNYGEFVQVNTEKLMKCYGRSIALQTGPGEGAIERYGSTLGFFKSMNDIKEKGNFILSSSIFPEAMNPKDVCDEILKELYSKCH